MKLTLEWVIWNILLVEDVIGVVKFSKIHGVLRAVYMLLDLGFQQEARENSKKRNK